MIGFFANPNSPEGLSSTSAYSNRNFRRLGLGLSSAVTSLFGSAFKSYRLFCKVFLVSITSTAFYCTLLGSEVVGINNIDCNLEFFLKTGICPCERSSI